MSLLSRFTASIRHRDWFAALIDVGVVAVGILLALAVDTWKSEYDKRKTEGEVLARIQQEVALLRKDLQSDGDRTLAYFETFTNLRKVLFQASTRNTISNQECDLLLDGLPEANYRIPVLDELTFAGNLDAIVTPKARIAAVEFINKRNFAQLSISRLLNEMVIIPRAFPELVKIELVETDNPDDLDGFVLSATCDLTAMRQSGEFMNEIAFTGSLLTTLVLRRQQLMQATDALAAATQH